MQAAHAGDLLLRVGDLVRVDRLLCLEHRVDAFRRDDRLALVTER